MRQGDNTVTLSSQSKLSETARDALAMALKITLKPGEKLFLGGAVIRNGQQRTQIFIENKVPLLRQKEIMVESQVKTFADQIYFLVQAAYMEGSFPKTYEETLSRMLAQFLKTMPESAPVALRIAQQVQARDFYNALKSCRELSALEREQSEASPETAGDPGDARQDPVI